MVAYSFRHRRVSPSRYLPAPAPATAPPPLPVAVQPADPPPPTRFERLKLAWLMMTARYLPARMLAPKPPVQRTL